VKLTKVDELILRTQTHWHLDEVDQCFFYGEYTARGGSAFSEANQLILNFKKGMERQSFPFEWRYKAGAIRQAAQMLRQSLAIEPNLQALRSATLVPIPPSKAKNDPLYDDRMMRTLQLMGEGLNLDIRELVLQTSTVTPSHSTDSRPSPDEIAANYQIDLNAKQPAPTAVWVFDDVLTTGAHFKAMKTVLQQTYPDVPCIGIFLARRVHKADEL
jgi:hypothetical protein